MPRRRRKGEMTPYQAELYQVLESHPGKWWYFLDLWNTAHPLDPDPPTYKIAAMGTALQHLEQNPDSKIVIRKDGRYKEVCYNPSGTLSDSDQPMATDSQIISEALVLYATENVTSDPQKALRAAFLAGKHVPCSIHTTTSTPKPKSSIPNEPKSDPPPLDGPHIPDEMSYEEFAAAARRAYADQAFTYEGVALRTGLSEEHIRRIIKEETTPTRDTLDKVCQAVFENYPLPK